MLLYKGSCEKLLASLQSVCGIVEKRNTLPILANVYLEKEGDRLTLLGSDIDIQITTHVTTESSEHVTLTVAARKLQDVLRSLPAGEVNLTFEDNRLQIRMGRSRFNLQTTEAETFPRMLLANGEQTSLKLGQGTFKRLLAQVQYAMAVQDIRYYLNGMLLVVRNNEICTVATDGHRLAFVRETLEENLPNIEVILPRKTVLELSRQLSENDDPLEIALTQTQAQFRFSGVELISKIIDGKFPDYQRVIPTGNDKCVVLNSQTFIQSLQRVKILTVEKTPGIRLIFANDSLRIIGNNIEREEAQEEIEITYTYPEIDVGFNINYLLDLLNNIHSDEFECFLGNASSSALFKLKDNENFKYVVMPMRV